MNTTTTEDRQRAMLDSLVEERRVAHKWWVEKTDWCELPEVHKRYGSANHPTLVTRRLECDTMEALVTRLDVRIGLAKANVAELDDAAKGVEK